MAIWAQSIDVANLMEKEFRSFQIKSRTQRLNLKLQQLIYFTSHQPRHRSRMVNDSMKTTIPVNVDGAKYRVNVVNGAFS